MDKQIYKPRIIDHQVEEYLSAFGAICVEGPNGAARPGLPLITARVRSILVTLPATFRTVSWRSCLLLWCWRERRPG